MKNQSGTELLASIKSMRAFLGDVSMLLQTADKLMEAQAWEGLWGANSLFEMSYRVGSGTSWMPREAVRVYRNESRYAQIMAMVSVLLDDDAVDYKLDQPVVSASCYVMQPGKKELLYWNCRWFGWWELEADGTVERIGKDDKDAAWKPSWGWDEMHVFGRPLVEITDEAKLKELIIDPLFKLIDAQA